MKVKKIFKASQFQSAEFFVLEIANVSIAKTHLKKRAKFFASCQDTFLT
jgi:hypothetical protein